MKPVLPASPASQTPVVVPDPLPPFSNQAASAALLGLLPILGTVAAVALKMGEDEIAALMSFCALLAFIGFVTAIIAASRLGRMPSETRPRGLLLAALAIPLSLVASLWGALMAFIATVDFSRGRQLRERGAAVFAPLVEKDTWLRESPSVDAPVDVADAWRENGKTEHASVAAFAKLASELVSLGAPSKLIEDAHKDALDEIQHARLCFTLARAIDGRVVEPGALPAAKPTINLPLPRNARLARLAVESLIDGALNEGTSARVVARLARRVSDPGIRAVLLAIAGDEGRHAAHGWDVLAWCIEEGGETVRAAVRGALKHLPEHMGHSLVSGGDDGKWERYGIPSRELQNACYADVRADVIAGANTLVVSKQAA